MPPGGLIVALVVLYFATETFLRRGQAARSFEPGTFDRASTRLIVVSYVIAIALPIVLDELDAGELGSAREPAAWTGVALMSAGIGFHAWAMIVLGRFYTRTLRVSEGQRLVRSGPYRVLRHPGYVGAIVTFGGAALARASWLGTAIVLGLLGAVFVYRIRTEEAMLTEAFGDEYRSYAARTWRLVPLVW